MTTTRLHRDDDGAFVAWYGREGLIAGVLTHERDDDYDRGPRAHRRGGSMAPVSVVVIPARDEAATIAACLTALAHQTVGPAAFETILVADACSDDTEAVARAAAQRLGLTLTRPARAGRGLGAGAAPGHGRRRRPARGVGATATG